jgi:hypothetical protein
MSQRGSKSSCDETEVSYLPHPAYFFLTHYVAPSTQTQSPRGQVIRSIEFIQKHAHCGQRNGHVEVLIQIPDSYALIEAIFTRIYF